MLHLQKFIVLDPSPDSGVGLGLDAGERYEAYVSYVESPSQFWIQRTDSEQTLEEIGAALENAEKTTVERKEIVVGEVFAARYVWFPDIPFSGLIRSAFKKHMSFFVHFFQDESLS